MPKMKYKYKDMDKFNKARYRQRKRYYDKTAIYPRRSWTTEEMDLIMKRDITDTQLSEKMQRSVRAIQIMRHKIKHGEGGIDD